MPWDWTSFPEPNVTNYTGMLNYANEVTGFMFGNFLVFAIFIVAFISLRNYPTGKAFAVSSYITFVLSMLLTILGLTAAYMPVFFFVFSLVGAAFIWKKERSAR